MITRRRIIYKCIALSGIVGLVLFVTSSLRATSSDDDIHKLMGREHGIDMGNMDRQAFHNALRSRGRTGGQYTPRTLKTNDKSNDYIGMEDIEREDQNEWINSAQLEMGLQIKPELNLNDLIKGALPIQENVKPPDKQIHQVRLRDQLPVVIDGEHLKDDSNVLDDPKQDRYGRAGEQIKNEPFKQLLHGDNRILKEGAEVAFPKEGAAADVAKPEALPDKPPIVPNHANKTTGAKPPPRKRVRVIRKTMRNGVVIREEVVGIKTVIANATKTNTRGMSNVLTYEEIWYSDILKGNFKANPVKLKNKTRDSPYLTEKLWRFQDTNSERLFLYERLLQHGWHRNPTNLNHLRQELWESGIDAENDLVVTQENAPLDSTLPFYISTKVTVGNKTERLYAYNVTSKFRQNIPEESPFRGKKYKRCAVIGNSGSILNSGCGSEIDEYDMIFRCNAAPIHKYAHDAGWKSNITTFNPSIFYRRFNTLQTREDYLRFKQNITQYNGYVWLACFGSAALHNVCLTPVLTGDSRKPNEPQLVLSNPNQFANFWQFWKTRNITKTPSTGFFMTHAALELCEETHLYGFWPFPLRLDTGFERVPYHYFDDLVVSKRHGMSDEFSVFLQYHELGILRLHTGKCQSEKT